jgi:hypothetical protein
LHTRYGVSEWYPSGIAFTAIAFLLSAYSALPTLFCTTSATAAACRKATIWGPMD